MKKEFQFITGTLVWYYYICKREVWLMSRHLTPDQEDPFIEIGRLISESAYRDERKEIRVENMVLDLLKNRLNALISFGNSLLYTICLSEIFFTHLDPRIGFLHTTNFRRFSLNLDLAEVFKPIIVDRVIFTLINKGMIKGKHFEKRLEGIVLNDDGKRLFIEQLDERLKNTFYYRRLKRKVSYRRLIRLELYKIEKHLIGEEEYSPFIAYW